MNKVEAKHVQRGKSRIPLLLAMAEMVGGVNTAHRYSVEPPKNY